MFDVGKNHESYIVDTIKAPPTGVVLHQEDGTAVGSAIYKPSPSRPIPAAGNIIRSGQISAYGTIKEVEIGELPIDILIKNATGYLGIRKFCVQRNGGEYQINPKFSQFYNSNNFEIAPGNMWTYTRAAPVEAPDGYMYVFFMRQDYKIVAYRYLQGHETENYFESLPESALPINQMAGIEGFKNPDIDAFLFDGRVFIVLSDEGEGARTSNAYIFTFDLEQLSYSFHSGPIGNFGSGSYVINGGVAGTASGNGIVIAVGVTIDGTSRAISVISSSDSEEWQTTGISTSYDIVDVYDRAVSDKLTSMSINPAGIGFFVANHRIYKTTDHGATWSIIKEFGVGSGGGIPSLKTIRVNESAVLVGGAEGFIAYSGNAGGTWHIIHGSPSVTPANTPLFPDIPKTITNLVFRTGVSGNTISFLIHGGGLIDNTDTTGMDKICLGELNIATNTMTSGGWVASLDTVGRYGVIGVHETPLSNRVVLYDGPSTAAQIFHSSGGKLGEITLSDGARFTASCKKNETDTLVYAAATDGKAYVVKIEEYKAEVFSTLLSTGTDSDGKPVVNYITVDAEKVYFCTSLGSVIIYNHDGEYVKTIQASPADEKSWPGIVGFHGRDTQLSLSVIGHFNIYGPSDENGIYLNSTASQNRIWPSLGVTPRGDIFMGDLNMSSGTIEVWQRVGTQMQRLPNTYGGVVIPASQIPATGLPVDITNIKGLVPRVKVVIMPTGEPAVLTLDQAIVALDEAGSKWVSGTAPELTIPVYGLESNAYQLAGYDRSNAAFSFSAIAYGNMRLFAFIQSQDFPFKIASWQARTWDLVDGTTTLYPPEVNTDDGGYWIGIGDIRVSIDESVSAFDRWTIKATSPFALANIQVPSPSILWRSKDFQTFPPGAGLDWMTIYWDREDSDIVSAYGDEKHWFAEAAALFRTNFPYAEWGITIPPYDTTYTGTAATWFLNNPGNYASFPLSSVVESGSAPLVAQTGGSNLKDPSKSWAAGRFNQGSHEYFISTGSETRRIRTNTKDTLIYEGSPLMLSDAETPYIIFSDRMYNLGDDGSAWQDGTLLRPFNIADTGREFGRYIFIRIPIGAGSYRPCWNYFRIGTARIGRSTKVSIEQDGQIKKRNRWSAGFRWTIETSNYETTAIGNVSISRRLGRPRKVFNISYDQIDKWEQEVLFGVLMPDINQSIAFIPSLAEVDNVELVHLAGSTLDLQNVGRGNEASIGIQLVEDV